MLSESARYLKWNGNVPVPPCRARSPMARGEIRVFYSPAHEVPATSTCDFDVRARACITSRLRGYTKPRERTDRVRESGSERALGYTCENPFCAAGEGRCQAVLLLCGTVRRGSKKACTSFARPEKKDLGAQRERESEREGRGGYVTRRKKGARAKREAVNLGLLLGNRNSF